MLWDITWEQCKAGITMSGIMPMLPAGIEICFPPMSDTAMPSSLMSILLQFDPFQSPLQIPGRNAKQEAQIHKPVSGVTGDASAT
jgi:hypothetical protein